MNSEAIVVLLLVALATGFIIWVRMNSQDHEVGGRAGNVGVKSPRKRAVGSDTHEPARSLRAPSRKGESK